MSAGPSGSGPSSSSGSGGAPGPSGQVSQSDTSLWLHNKLGTSNDSWTGGSIVSQLSKEILVKIRDCFQDLQPQVKLKLLLSLFAIPRRNLEAWRRELEDILDVAADDSEPWVQMLSELMKTYPSSGTLNSDIHVPESNKKIFADLVSDMKKALKKSSAISSELHMSAATVLPIECLYLNKNAFISVVGHQPQHVKHFTLKRKPKAAAVRVDLLNKSADAANKVKSSGGHMGGFPMRKSTMPRKMDVSAALKGLNQRAPSSMLQDRGGGFRRPILNRPNARKSEGGVKLLDITEQPVNAMARKRKRQQEMEEAAAEKKKAQEQRAAEKQEQQENRDKNAAAVASTRNPASMGNNVGGVGGTEKATPDYAAGLSAMNPPTPAPPPPPSYAPPTPTAIQPPSAPKPSYAPSAAMEPPPLVVQPPQQQQQQQTLPQLQQMAAGATTNLQPQFQHLQPPPPPTTMLQQQQQHSTTAPTQTIALPATPLPNSAIQSNAPPPTILQTPRPPFPANLTSLEPLPPSAVVANAPQPQVYSSPTGPATQAAGAATATTTRIVRLPAQPLHPSQALPNQPLPPAQATAATNAARFVRTVGAPTILVQQPQQPQPRIIQQRTVRSVLSSLTPQPPASIQQQQQQQKQPQQQQQPQQPQPQQQQQSQQQQQQPGQQPQARRALTLTKEQMVEAQEMFRTANRVTRPEKALILGFMAGSRDNPCPHLGNVVTIKLAENQENVLQQDGTYLTMQIETHFQMNYSTGEWNRIRKYRRLEDAA